jgi:hypothetical protein
MVASENIEQRLQELCRQVQQEQDAEKVHCLIQEILELLAEQQKRMPKAPPGQ